MIFISHNVLDKPVVEPIALGLREKYGQDQIFYDSWSIQPGEVIIDRMNDGLEGCKVFLFFISKNSLNSKMVDIEWKRALEISLSSGMKLIPIRISKCSMPAILQGIRYIDFFDDDYLHVPDFLKQG